MSALLRAGIIAIIQIAFEFKDILIDQIKLFERAKVSHKFSINFRVTYKRYQCV